MSYPIIVGSLSVTVMGFVDQVFVSRLPDGDAAMAAVGSGGLWSYTATTFVLGAVGCVSTFVSQCVGRGDKHESGSYAWQGIYLSLLSALIALALWPLAAPMFAAMGHTPEITQGETIYFQVRLFGFVPYAWLVSLTAFFQAIGRPGIPAWAGVIGNIVNAFFAWALIFGNAGFPAWGIMGAGVALVIATLVQAGLLQALFLLPAVDAQFSTRRSYAPDLTKLGDLVRIGWAAGLSAFMDIFNWALFTGFVIGRLGETAFAAHQVALNFMHLSFMPAIGVHNAMAPIVGRYIGMGDIPRAKARTYTAIRLCMVYMFSLGVFMAVFGRPLIRFFFEPSADVVVLGHALLILAALFQAFDAINIVTMGSLRGAGDTRWMAFVGVMGAYGVFLPMALLLAWPTRWTIALACAVATVAVALLSLRWVGVETGRRAVLVLLAVNGVAFPVSLLLVWPEGWGAVGAWIGATLYIIGLSGFLFARFYGEEWRHIRIFSQDRIAAGAE